MKVQDLDSHNFSLAARKQILNGRNVKGHEVTCSHKKGMAKCHKLWTVLSNVLQSLCPYCKQPATLKNLKKYQRKCWYLLTARTKLDRSAE